MSRRVPLSLQSPPNHAFDRTRECVSSFSWPSVVAGRLTWSCWAALQYYGELGIARTRRSRSVCYLGFASLLPF